MSTLIHIGCNVKNRCTHKALPREDTLCMSTFERNWNKGISSGCRLLSETLIGLQSDSWVSNEDTPFGAFLKSCLYVHFFSFVSSVEYALWGYAPYLSCGFANGTPALHGNDISFSQVGVIWFICSWPSKITPWHLLLLELELEHISLCTEILRSTIQYGTLKSIPRVRRTISYPDNSQKISRRPSFNSMNARKCLQT